MPQSQVTSYIEITDFTPGIHDDYVTATTEAAQDGAAQKLDTWGCYAAPRGGLVPGPSPTGLTLYGLSNVHNTNATTPPTKRKIAVLDTALSVGISPPYSDLADATGDPDVLHIAVQKYYDSGAASNYKRQWAILTAKLTDDASTPAFAALASEFDWLGSEPVTDTAQMDYGFGSIEQTRVAFRPTLAFYVGGRLDDAVTESNRHDLWYWPDYAAADTDTPSVEIANKSYAFIVGHQGRIVAANMHAETGSYEDPGSNFRYGATLFTNVSEEIEWTNVPTFTFGPTIALESSAIFGAAYIEENPSGYGAWASMNASELILIKHKGGAAVVRGSLNNPTVVRLPGVESTYGITCKGVVTPLGFVYGSRTGVWVWNGSDTSKLLSPQLDGHFWRVTDTDDYHVMQSRGKFGYHHPFIFAPSNWMMDVRSGGWFRLTDPDDSTYGGEMSFYETNITGKFYGVPAAISLAGAGSASNFLVAAYTFDMSVPMPRYSWRSQPLARTRNRRIDIREINVVLQGEGEVTVELIGLDGQTDSKTFVVNSPDRPVAFTRSCKCSSHDVEVKITSAGTGDGSFGDTHPAPKLGRISLGYREAQSVGSGAQGVI